MRTRCCGHFHQNQKCLSAGEISLRSEHSIATSMRSRLESGWIYPKVDLGLSTPPVHLSVQASASEASDFWVPRTRLVVRSSRPYSLQILARSGMKPTLRPEIGSNKPITCRQSYRVAYAV